MLTFELPLKDETGNALAFASPTAFSRTHHGFCLRDRLPRMAIFVSPVDQFEGTAGYAVGMMGICGNSVATIGLESYLGDRSGFQTSTWMIVHPRLCPTLLSSSKVEAGEAMIVEPADP